MDKPKLSLTEFFEKYVKIKMPNGEVVDASLMKADKEFFEMIEKAKNDGYDLRFIHFRSGTRLMKVKSIK